MLVVIAIIAVLVSLLFPAYRRARESAYLVWCMNNLGQLSKSWTVYTQDHSGRLVNAATGVNPLTPELEAGWVLPGNSRDSVIQGPFYPWVPSLEIFHCPKDETGHFRSYSISDYLNGGEYTEGREVRTVNPIAQPAQAILMMEENDPRGYNMNGWCVPPRQTQRFNKTQWVDPAVWWHFEGATLSFVDGHVEHWVWTDPRTYAVVFFMDTPENADIARIKEAIEPLRALLKP